MPETNKAYRKILVITNVPAPYRIPVFNLLAERYGDNITVMYSHFAGRQWSGSTEAMNHNFVALKGKTIRIFNHRIRINYYILSELLKAKPDMIVNAGLSVTNVVAWLYSRMFGKKHVVLSDTWALPESKLTITHRVLRELVFRFSDAFVCIGAKGRDYFRSFNISPRSIFVSPLSVDNLKYREYLGSEKRFDLVFSGQFVSRKMPLFVIDVVKRVNELRPNTTLLMMGSGRLEKEIISKLDRAGIRYQYAGFVEQKDLPIHYSSARILLFPSQYDAWGVVANEAMAAGLPVVTCDDAGAANDLVQDGVNGFVLPLDVDIWSERIVDLLSNPEKYRRFSENALKKVSDYSFDRSANGIIQAIEYVSG